MKGTSPGGGCVVFCINGSCAVYVSPVRLNPNPFPQEEQYRTQRSVSNERDPYLLTPNKMMPVVDLCARLEVLLPRQIHHACSGFFS